MVRFCLAAAVLATTISFVGCVGGPCCGPCDGCGDFSYAQPIPDGPLHQLRAWRQSMVCGAGCGHVYVGEWTSYPPDCQEPCPPAGHGYLDGCACGVGPCICGGPCADCCGCRPRIRPLRAIARIAVALYGKRFCEACGYEFDDCCCAGGEFVAESGCADGCASGQCGVQGSNQLSQQTRLAKSQRSIKGPRSSGHYRRPARSATALSVPAPVVKQASKIPPKPADESTRR